ncbi:YciI family protein [soil metagenome]
MQYLISVIDNRTASGTDEEAVAIDAFNEKLQAGGHWVFAAGLGAPSSATVVDNRDGVTDAIITDGPFVETKEHMAGLWVWECADLDEALALAVEGSKACNRRLEVKPMLNPPE